MNKSKKNTIKTHTTLTVYQSEYIIIPPYFIDVLCL